ncbi:MAG: hypothetical protein R3338_14665, partial [Thermoanaerobaculia bacterium]|nr:hypothetical protein [Thermoanaerobaculia bacterium]
LEIASVIGRRFPVSLVAATLPAADDDLERICERLTRESSILESAGTEQWGDGALTSSYAFTHDLYVDVVYEGIPALRRARLHQLVGQALERAWEGREREHAPELALHFHRSSDHSRGPKYLHLAAEHALERSAYREAVDHLSAAIEMLEGAPESGDRQRLELRIRCRLAPSLVATRGWADSEAEENYLKARDLAEELEEFALLSQTLYGLANMYEYRGEYALAERIARKRLALDETGVPTQSLESNELLTCSLLHQGRYGESVRHGEEALAAYADVDPVTLDPEELVLIVQAHGWMSASLHFAGRIDDALSHSREAIRLAEGIDNQLAKASAHIQGAFLRFYRCEEDACGELARRGGAISREFRFPFHVACSRILQGWTLSGADEPGDAVREIRAGIRTSEAIGARMDLPLFYSILAGALVRSGDPEKALNASDRAIEILDRGRTFFYVPELHRQRGLILLDLGRSDEGLESLDEAFELAQSQECLLFALRAATDLARLGKKTWETRVGKIYDRFSQGLDTKDLEKAAAILK